MPWEVGIIKNGKKSSLEAKKQSVGLLEWLEMIDSFHWFAYKDSGEFLSQQKPRTENAFNLSQNCLSVSGSTRVV